MNQTDFITTIDIIIKYLPSSLDDKQVKQDSKSK